MRCTILLQPLHRPVIVLKGLVRVRLLLIYCRLFLIGIESVEVKPTIAKKFRRMMNKLSDGTNISGSCVNWYRNKSGINYVLWPTNTLRYWWMTRRVDLLRDFKLSVMD